MDTLHKQTLRLKVVADVICPWCFVGKRSLDQALTILAERGIDVEVEWLPFQLNPALPEGGMDRKEFRTMRFGWENSLVMDQRAVEAGERLGAEFNYHLQSRTPNTVAAHALSLLARIEGGASLQERVVDALMTAYFTDGRDIGDHVVLAQIAEEAGMEAGAFQRSLPLQAEIRNVEVEVRGIGITGVPSYLLGDNLWFSGSQDVETYVKNLAGAAKR